MAQEMCEVQSELLGNPREFWTNRDESFMGVVSSMAHSRGGSATAWTIPLRESRALALMIGCEKAICKKKNWTQSRHNQYQRILTVSQVGPTPMFSRSRAVLTVSTIALLCFSGQVAQLQKTRHQSKTACTKAQQHCSRDTPTHAPHPTWHQHQRILTVSQVGPTPMFSKSCARHTISTSGHQWSFWSGDRWRHVFGSRLHFYALSASRIRRPWCYDVRAFPECSNARVGTHMPVGRPCWSQIIRFHHRVTEHFTFLFFTRQKKQCHFSLELQFLHCLENCVLLCKNCNALSFFGCILEQCKFYTRIIKRSSAKQNGCSGNLHVAGSPGVDTPGDPGTASPR